MTCSCVWVIPISWGEIDPRTVMISFGLLGMELFLKILIKILDGSGRELLGIARGFGIVGGEILDTIETEIPDVVKFAKNCRIVDRPLGKIRRNGPRHCLADVHVPDKRMQRVGPRQIYSLT